MRMSHTKVKDCPSAVEHFSADCLFCRILEFHERPIFAKNDSFVAVRDQYPVSDGHTLIFPRRRHVTKMTDLSPTEMMAFTDILRIVQEQLDEDYSPDGYNIGVNEGTAAGQTIAHLHIHVIPRYVGDVEEPRGGVRNIKKSLIPY
jgi:diadenosine tetraphosphate (Ap4A) HIT family hydrolase